jgi:hypothetical protein
MGGVRRAHGELRWCGGTPCRALRFLLFGKGCCARNALLLRLIGWEFAAAHAASGSGMVGGESEGADGWSEGVVALNYGSRVIILLIMSKMAMIRLWYVQKKYLSREQSPW